MPGIDLNAILTPIITGVVAPLVFPTTVALEQPVVEQSDTGAPTRTWQVVTPTIPAMIEPASANEQTISLPVVLSITDAKITLPGDVAIDSDWRITDEGTGDHWDVLGVQYDAVRVLTTVVGRRAEPGTPDEGDAS